jgi:hypothetical protein
VSGRGTSTSIIAFAWACASLVVLPASASADHRFRIPDYRVWGVMVDAGVPDGFNGSLTYRPDPQLRLHLGGGHNLIGKGVRAGVTMLTRRGWFSPSLTFEAGHYFRGNANRLAQQVSEDETIDITALQSVGYRYGNAHIGFEMGVRRLTFYFHAGGSFIMTTLRGLEQTIAEQMPHEEGDPMIEIRDDPEVLAFTISARLGLILYF